MTHRGPSPWFVGRAVVRCAACDIDQEMDASEAADVIPRCPKCDGEMVTVEMTAVIDPSRERKSK